MKTTLLIFLSTILFGHTLMAQKNYSIANAKVHFTAQDDQDIDAVNKEVVSKLQSNGDLSFMMLIKGFQFEMKEMQDHFNTKYLESDKFPRALFNGRIQNYNTVIFSKDGKYPIQITGVMQIHGVNKKMDTAGFIEIKGGIITATAHCTVSLKDFNIGGLLINWVADKINIDITARYQ